MRISSLTRLMPALLLCGGGVLVASEADELRERAEAMRREASVVAERGNRDEAERLEHEALKLQEAAERMESKAGERGERNGDRERRNLEGRLHDLVARERELREVEAPDRELAEVREQIAGTERELHALQAHRGGKAGIPPEFRPQIEKLEAADRRIHHLRIAAENLMAAEAHDLAHQVSEMAEAMERDVHEARKRLEVEMGRMHGGEHGPDVVRELRSQIEQLRAEIEELRRNVRYR